MDELRFDALLLIIVNLCFTYVLVDTARCFCKSIFFFTHTSVNFVAGSFIYATSTV